MIENALAFQSAGLSIMPIRADGSKSPIYPWKSFQTTAPNEMTVKLWYQVRCPDAGTAIVCGAVSGGLEIFDFDHDAETIYPAWADMVDSILCRLPVVETPSGGYHVYYRCNTVCGSKRIALGRNNEVLIETRGEGGSIVTVISPAEVHRMKMPYVQVAGPVLPEIPRITPSERKSLWAAAATFDRSGIRQREIKRLATRQRLANVASCLPDRRAIDRARRYVSKMDPAIGGSGGHAATFKVACVLVLGFNLGESDSLALLAEYNQSCDPPWSEYELGHKISEANKKDGPRGYLLGGGSNGN